LCKTRDLSGWDSGQIEVTYPNGAEEVIAFDARGDRHGAGRRRVFFESKEEGALLALGHLE
jgi:hypothetical protein